MELWKKLNLVIFHLNIYIRFSLRSSLIYFTRILSWFENDFQIQLLLNIMCYVMPHMLHIASSLQNSYKRALHYFHHSPNEWPKSVTKQGIWQSHTTCNYCSYKCNPDTFSRTYLSPTRFLFFLCHKILFF